MFLAPELGPPSVWRQRDRILVRHQSSDKEAWLPLEAESQGTLTLLRMVPQLVRTLSAGGVLVVNELEASLHPLLALQVLRQFNDLQTNPHGAQIIFTTHDTNLLGNVLGESPLRRDQIWLVLHFRDNPGAQERHAMQRLLRQYLPGYDKHLSFEAVAPGLDDASARARQLDDLADADGDSGRNPTTGVYRLTDSMRGR